MATVIRGVLNLPSLGHDPDSPSGIGSCPAPCLLDATGRRVTGLRIGPNNVSRFASGVYFVREVLSGQASEVRCRIVIVQK